MTMMRRGLALLIPPGVFLTTAAMYGMQDSAPRASIESRPAAPAAGVGGGFIVDKAAEVRKRAAAARPPAKKVDEEAIFQVEVSHRLHLEGATAALYQSVAERLSKYSAVPDERRRQFSGYHQSDSFQWAGSVLDVRETPAGAIVEVRVGPRTGLIYCPQQRYYEHYLLTPDGAVIYLRSSDPYGASGRSPLGAVHI